MCATTATTRIEIAGLEKAGGTYFSFKDDSRAFETHLVAFQLLRKAHAERMNAEYHSKHGVPITVSELNAALMRRVRSRDRVEVLHDMVVFVIHHMGVYRQNVQDARYPELIPIVLRILKRWDNDAESLKTEIVRKGEIFDDLVKVMEHISLVEAGKCGHTNVESKNNPAYLVDYFSNLTLTDEDEDEDDAELFGPEYEADAGEPEDSGSPSKSVKRCAALEPLRPADECKKNHAAG